MRPIDKGQDRRLRDLSEARRLLSAQVGEYCAYCEIRLGSLEIEHIQPQSTHPELVTDWSNLLLACGYCNKFKSNKPSDNCYFPHTHNTALAFAYIASLPPAPSDNLTDTQRIMAQNTIDLAGLSRTSGQHQSRREGAYGHARRAFMRLQQQPDNDLLKEATVDTATSTGFFSIWLTVFQDNPELCVRLIQAFKGTARDCFDAQGKPADSRTRPLL